MDKFMDPSGLKRFLALETRLSCIPRPISNECLLEEVEKVVRYKIKIWWMNTDYSFWGKVFVNGDHFVVCINKNLRELEQRFVIAHEVAHILHSFWFNYSYGKPGARSFIPGCNRYVSLEEELCDYMAMRLLAPEKQVARWIQRYYTLPYQLSLFDEVQRGEGMALFSLAKHFSVPVKEMGLWVKQIATNRTIGISSREDVTPFPSVRECIGKIALTT